MSYLVMIKKPWQQIRQQHRLLMATLGLWPGALGGTRTPNLLIRSQMLYPLSYERRRTPHSVRHLHGTCRQSPAVLLAQPQA